MVFHHTKDYLSPSQTSPSTQQKTIFHPAKDSLLSTFPLEVHAEGGEEGAGVGGVEVVVGDVGQTEVVAHLGIEEVVLNTTTQADAAVEALEAFIVERAVGMTLAEVLDLAGHAQRHIAAKEGLDAERAVDIDLVFEHHGQLEVAETVRELTAVVVALATFFNIGEAGLEIDR